MARREIRGSRAIVTGASSGIGREIALALAAEGADVVLVARRRERLEELAAEIKTGGARAEVVAGDLSEPSIRAEAVETAVSRFGGLDILVNNAGIGAMGRFENADPGRVRPIMEVNFFALVEMIRAALPALKQGTRPIIVNVSSILGRRGMPHSSEYCASKFAVCGFSESLRAELHKHRIDVLVVNPGTTESEFLDRVIERAGEPKWPPHTVMPAAEVARQTVRAIRRGKHEIVTYGAGRWLLRLNAVAPRLIDWLMNRYG
jgi:short-subunit dehydrogenase